MSAQSVYPDLKSYIISLDTGSLSETFGSTEKCLRVLSEWKWKDGFTCRKCGGTNYCKGKTPYSRRCTSCKSDESATAHTVFHHCRISLPLAFEMAYVCCSKPGTPASEISRKFETREMTCLKFKKRILGCSGEGGNLLNAY